MGIISERRKRQRMRRIARRLTVVMIVALLGLAAMSPGLRERVEAIARGAQAAFAGGEGAQAELTLPQREIYAMQLGVFDNGERAAAEAKRLQESGVRCVVWQREKLRIVCAVAQSREALDGGGQAGYVISETLPRVSLRVTAQARALEKAQALIALPDTLLVALLGQERPLEELLPGTREQAQAALSTHPDNVLYTQLAQSLLNWCALMDSVRQEADGQAARRYAALTMCTLCRELRTVLQSQTASAASTASAQRTPSTAAEVIPPA